tara:strand:+ start:406 stop:816 length:411 start_codon:yes stop_codon:yes gene_type:complete
MVFGCLAASVAAGLVGAAVFVSLVQMQDPTVREGGEWLGLMMVFGLIISTYGVISSFTLGLLAHALLTRLHWTGWLSYMFVGLVAGALVGLLFGGAREFAIFGAAAGAGMAGALAFRAIVRPRRQFVTADAGGLNR